MAHCEQDLKWWTHCEWVQNSKLPINQTSKTLFLKFQHMPLKKYQKQEVFCQVCLVSAVCTWLLYVHDFIAVGLELPRIEIRSQNTKFWRHQQDKPSTYLATIEAVYYFLREYHHICMAETYKGQYDNLLFYFVFHYQQIREQYDNGKYLKAYDRKKTGKQSSKKDKFNVE